METKETTAQSANPGRTAEAALYHERQERKRVEGSQKGRESFHVIGNDKVVKRTKMPSGNTHSVYIGTKKECDKAGIKYSK